MAAWSAQIGSISVTRTLQPAFLKLSADPFPTSPYPATIATLPAIMTSVALLMPSTKLSLQPYLLSNFDFVTESFTLIAGTFNLPSFSISTSLRTPVVVSSESPFISSRYSGYFS